MMEAVSDALAALVAHYDAVLEKFSSVWWAYAGGPVAYALYGVWWAIFLCWCYGPLGKVVMRPPPASEALALAPAPTLTEAQLDQLEAAASGAPEVPGVYETDGRWFEATVDFHGVPRAHAAGLRAAKKEDKLRFVARKAVELRGAAPEPVFTLKREPICCGGVVYAAFLEAPAPPDALTDEGHVILVPGVGTYDPGAPPGGEALGEADAALVVAHVAALLGAQCRAGQEKGDSTSLQRGCSRSNIQKESIHALSSSR